MEDDLEKLRQALAENGICADAPVGETLGTRSTARVSLRLDGAQAPAHEFVEYQEIGRGGMARVWAASQVALGRDVALKRVADPTDREGERLLLREATVAAQLEHPNIVPVHQLLVDARGPAVVMKRVAGETWARLVEDPRVGLEAHLDIFLQTLNAVEFAHSRGVIHRDIKPENVMVGDYHEVYLMDWGVAATKHDEPSSDIVGTPCYMAPEMAEGRADERTDVFLLGATLHAVLTGLPRHEGASPLLVLYAAMYVEPFVYSESVPAELAALCNRACARQPEARFPHVKALRDAVLRYREHRAANVLTETALERLTQLAAWTSAECAGEHSYSDVQRIFSDARLSFEAALRVWPESGPARAGLTRCLQTMVEHELSRRQPDIAEALLAMLPTPDVALVLRAARLREELTREQLRIQRIERDNDANVGAQARTRAYLWLGALTALMTLVLFARRIWLPSHMLSTSRLTVIGAIVLSIMLLVAHAWRRYGLLNAINRKIGYLTISTLTVSFLSRLSGYLTDTSPERVLITDAFILGLGGLLLAPYHHAGRWLATMSFGIALAGSLYPSLIDEAFITLSIVVPAAMWLLRGEAVAAPKAAAHDQRAPDLA